MEILHSRSPQTYITPSDSEISKMAEEIGLGRFDKALIKDMCNKAAGGDSIPPSEYRSQLAEIAEKNLGKPDSDGEWRISRSFPDASGNDSTSCYTSRKAIAIQDRVNSLMLHHESVSDFLKAMDFDKVPGDSPLEKAVNMYKILQDKWKKETGQEEFDHTEFFSGSSGQSKASEISNLLDSVNSMDEVEKFLFGQESGNSSNSLAKRKILEEMAQDKLVWLKISRVLDELAIMKVSKSLIIRQDPNGNQTRHRKLRNLNELSKINKTGFALKQSQETYFWYKAVSRQLTVSEKVSREEKKQLLYMIADCSGSMKEDDRIAKAGGILFNRLKAVVSGDAEIYIRFFDGDIHEEYHAKTKKEARDLMEKFQEENFSGGSTNIDKAIKKVQNRIEEIVETENVAKPELVAVTDGDDSVNITLEDLKGTRLHAFLVGGRNSTLKNLAKSTGGVGIDL